MRVAMVDPSLFTLPYDRALASALGRAGHDVTLFGRRPGPDDNDAEGISLEPHFYRIANSRAARHLPTPARLGLKGIDHAASMWLLLRRLRRERPDIIHFQWLPLPLVDGRLLGLFRKVAPLVLTVHDTNPFNGDPSASLQQRGFFRSLNEFDRLIVHTAQGRERLCSAGVPANRILVLPMGMHLDPPPYVDDPMTGPMTFLLFGKVKPYKGLDLLIEAFGSLHPLVRGDARIWVVGKPYMDMAPLQALAERLGVADRLVIEPRFVGDDEVAGLFAPGTVAVFPYREIEASAVLSIALACGRPVIASNLGNFAETVTDGVQGHLVLSGDIPALAAAMTHMLSDRDFAASCGRQARTLVDAAPSWDGIAALTADAYRSVA
jgi:glycosyltransferase involved in cell wall biosynthesis